MKKIQQCFLSTVIALAPISFTGCSHLPFFPREPISLIYEGEIDGENIIYYEKPFDKTGYGRLDILDSQGYPKEIMIDGYNIQKSGDGAIDYYFLGRNVYTEEYVMANGKTIRGKGALSAEILDISKRKLAGATSKYKGLLKKIKEKKIKEFE